MHAVNEVVIVGARELSPDQDRQLQRLREAIRSHERVELPLFSSPFPHDRTATTMFLAHMGEELVGFASLPVQETPELVAAVHPGYRRRGIGRRLFAAVREEARRRGCAELILVGEVGALAGLGFAEAVGGRFDCAEYQLELRASEYAGPAAALDSLEVVPASREDVQLLSLIGSEAFGPGRGNQPERLMRWFDSPGHRLFLAFASGEPVGTLRVSQDPGNAVAYIYAFGVRRAHQRRGYGRALLNTVLARLFTEGCTAVRLEVETTNAPAYALYRSTGFQLLTEFRYFRMPA